MLLISYSFFPSLSWSFQKIKKTSLNMISKIACLMKIVLRTIALNISQADWAWFMRHWHEINDPESLNPFICYFLQRDLLAVWAVRMKWNSLPFLFIHTFLYDVSSMTMWLLGMFECDTLVIGAYSCVIDLLFLNRDYFIFGFTLSHSH